ncbi:hypothetical protein EST38_g8563 [Candolleomyces aberdarensis]|uniref:Small RNA 2'-O-methyltransferase n=1 Tax=Candolleomyces aberdarensis TaxID=2316362 RepID=A0A4Q2DCC0_9AGAR|nr:hypothetical protein EST38_g8563 [Candolleomyces aberdarensis]
MAPIKEILLEEDDETELKVHFYPELHLQRRIWILDTLRRENITKVLDVGCGEGSLLSPLCQPAPWLPPPPSDRLPALSPSAHAGAPGSPLLSPTFNSVDGIQNLHVELIHGLDISPDDLAFAINTTQPPEPLPPSTYTVSLTRFEPLDVKLWEGGLETINEEFVGIECIVSTEVIEHLSPETLPYFVPILLGVYHPKFLLVTTPSYTFNARFTAPDAPPSVRKGYSDPTKRTDRIFRHSDHKFEWTREEFEAWVSETAKEWGYEATWTSIGRSLDKDPYGRDEELGGASFVVEFRKADHDQPLGDQAAGALTDSECERRGRELVSKLDHTNNDGVEKPSHKLAAHQHHPAHTSAQKPLPFPEIASIIKNKMDFYREFILRLSELWFEADVAIACGGWIEFLVRAVEESPELILRKEENGIKMGRDQWTVEIAGRAGGGSLSSRNLWLDTDVELEPNDGSFDHVPEDWTPDQGPLSLDDSTDLDESTGAEGDISLNNSEDEGEIHIWSGNSVHSTSDWEEPSIKGWGGGWGVTHGTESSDDEAKSTTKPPTAPNPGSKKVRHVASSSTAGWDGDEDESDDTTS